MPPLSCTLKANFDVAVRTKLSVALSMVCNDTCQTLAASSLKINSIEVNVGEATTATLLTSDLAFSLGADKLLLRGDSLATAMALKKPIFIRN
jgi:hypothetical protein